MKTRYKQIHKFLSGLTIVPGVLCAPLVVSPTVGAELKCGILPQSICKNADQPPSGNDVKNTATWGLLKLGVQIMTAGVAILAIAGIIYGSVLYISAGPNQEQVKKAKGIFLNVVIGIVAFAAMFGFLQWLIPGGVF